MSNTYVDQTKKEFVSMFIEMIEKGTLPWRKGWLVNNGGWPRNPIGGNTFQGMNVLALLIHAELNHFKYPYWATANAWKSKDCKVKNGQWNKNMKVLNFRPLIKEKEEEDGTIKKTFIPFWKVYSEYNLEQVEGEYADSLIAELESKPTTQSPEELKEVFDRANEVVDKLQANIEYKVEDKACYNVRLDKITMPPLDRFHKETDFHETRFHELMHWTRHPSRLDRNYTGEIGYAREELIAELGSCFIMGELGIPMKEFSDNSAAYLKSWLDGMKQEPKYLYQVMAESVKANNFVLGKKFTQEEPKEESSLVGVH